MDKALSILESASTEQKENDADEAFGRTVGLQLKSIGNIQNSEYAKLKIQEILYQAQFGLLTQCLPQQPSAQFQMSSPIGSTQTSNG